jgi:hypothetical protein
VKPEGTVPRLPHGSATITFTCTQDSGVAPRCAVTAIVYGDRL